MLPFVSVFLAFLATHASDVLAAPGAQAAPSPSICHGFQWGVTIEELISEPMPVYNQYVRTTACAGPAWVQSSTEPTPPASINPWGTRYLCQVPEDTYFCGTAPVATCCGNITSVST